MIILDSDHWIAVLRGTLDLRGRVDVTTELAITAISVGELSYGVERSAKPIERRLALDILLANAVILPYDDLAAYRFGSLKVALERRGERLDDADLQIAAITLAQGLTLVTHNTRHFRRVPGLVLEDWLI